MEKLSKLISRLKHINKPNEQRMSFTQKIMYISLRVRLFCYVSFTSVFTKVQLRLWGADVGKYLKVKGFLVLRPLGELL